jgi:hypothetical protein
MMQLEQLAEIVCLTVSTPTTSSVWNEQIVAALARKGISSAISEFQGRLLVLVDRFACYYPPCHYRMGQAFRDFGTTLEKENLCGGILLARRKIELFTTEWNSRSGLPIPVIFLPYHHPA